MRHAKQSSLERSERPFSKGYLMRRPASQILFSRRPCPALSPSAATIRARTLLFLENRMCGPAASKVKPSSTTDAQRPPIAGAASRISHGPGSCAARATPEMPPPRMPVDVRGNVLSQGCEEIASRTRPREGIGKSPHRRRARRPAWGARRPTGSARRPTGSARRPTGSARRPTGSACRPTGSARRPSGYARRPSWIARRPKGRARRPKGRARRPTRRASSHGERRVVPRGRRASSQGERVVPGESASSQGGERVVPRGERVVQGERVSSHGERALHGSERNKCTALRSSFASHWMTATSRRRCTMAQPGGRSPGSSRPCSPRASTAGRAAAGG